MWKKEKIVLLLFLLYLKVLIKVWNGNGGVNFFLIGLLLLINNKVIFYLNYGF